MRRLFSQLRLGGLLVLLCMGCARQLVFLPTAESQPPTPPLAQQRLALVVEVQGEAEVRPNLDSDWASAKFGVQLSQNSQVRTGADSRLLLRLTEGTKIWVGANTLFTFSLLNPFPENLLTALALDEGQVWVLLSGGALDVEMLGGNFRAAARSAYMSVQYDANTSALTITCLQGQCYFNDTEIPTSYKLADAVNNLVPEPMAFADYGAWGVNVPEATQLAYLATEALVQGDATLPVVPTEIPSATPVPSATPTTAPNEPMRTPAPPTLTPINTATPRPVVPTATRRPFTPIPPAPVIGRHVVLAGENLFCIARGYGVLPGAIAQANGLVTPFVVFPGRVLDIPQVQWVDISPGPVCAPQFVSPFPGLPTSTPPNPLSAYIDVQCVSNCNSNQGDYTLRLTIVAAGGVTPYTFTPAQAFEQTFSHCTHSSGSGSVASADGQTLNLTWSYQDVGCAPTNPPPPPPSDTPQPTNTATPVDTPTITPTNTPEPTSTLAL